MPCPSPSLAREMLVALDTGRYPERIELRIVLLELRGGLLRLASYCVHIRQKSRIIDDVDAALIIERNLAGGESNRSTRLESVTTSMCLRSTVRVCTRPSTFAACSTRYASGAGELISSRGGCRVTMLTKECHMYRPHALPGMVSR